jgi:hypothetical protein
VNGTRRLAVAGVAVVGVLINVAIWYGIPHLLGTSHADAAQTTPSASNSAGPLPTDTAGAGDNQVDASSTPSPSGSVSHTPGTTHGQQPPAGHNPPAPPGHPGTPPSTTRTTAPPPPPAARYKTVNASHGSATFKYTAGHVDVTSTSPADTYTATTTVVDAASVTVEFVSGQTKQTIFASVDKSGELQTSVVDSTTTG